MSLDVEALYTQEYDRLCGYFRKRLSRYDPAEAPDLAAAVFLRAWEKRHLYRPRPGVQPRAWLYAIAVNLLTDHYRYRERGKIQVVRLGEWTPFVTHVGTNEHVDQIDVASALASYRAGQPWWPTDKHLAVIRARYFEGGTDADVGRRLGMTEQTVKSLRRRALANLRKMVGAA